MRVECIDNNNFEGKLIKVGKFSDKPEMCVNKVANKIEIIESDGFQKVLPNELFDFIITNPPIRAGKAVIYQMYEDAKNHLVDGGKLVLVINKKHGAPSTITFLESIFENVQVLDKKAGFHVIECVK